MWNVYGNFVFSVQSSYRPKAALRNGGGGGSSGGLVAKSCLTLVISRAVAHQAPLSMGFPRQEYWTGLPFPSPGDLPDPGTELATLMSPALASRFFATSATWEASDDSYIMMSNYFRRKLQQS